MTRGRAAPQRETRRKRRKTDHSGDPIVTPEPASVPVVSPTRKNPKRGRTRDAEAPEQSQVATKTKKAKVDKKAEPIKDDKASDTHLKDQAPAGAHVSDDEDSTGRTTPAVTKKKAPKTKSPVATSTTAGISKKPFKSPKVEAKLPAAPVTKPPTVNQNPKRGRLAPLFVFGAAVATTAFVAKNTIEYASQHPYFAPEQPGVTASNDPLGILMNPPSKNSASPRKPKLRRLARKKTQPITDAAASFVTEQPKVNLRKRKAQVEQGSSPKRVKNGIRKNPLTKIREGLGNLVRSASISNVVGSRNSKGLTVLKRESA